jgi:hypothetical protein
MNDSTFETSDLVEHDLVLIDKFEIHDNPLDEWRNRDSRNDLYVKCAEWNTQKWY